MLFISVFVHYILLISASDSESSNSNHGTSPTRASAVQLRELQIGHDIDVHVPMDKGAKQDQTKKSHTDPVVDDETKRNTLDRRLLKTKSRNNSSLLNEPAKLDSKKAKQRDKEDTSSSAPTSRPNREPEVPGFCFYAWCSQGGCDDDRYQLVNQKETQATGVSPTTSIDTEGQSEPPQFIGDTICKPSQPNKELPTTSSSRVADTRFKVERVTEQSTSEGAVSADNTGKASKSKNLFRRIFGRKSKDSQNKKPVLNGQVLTGQGAQASKDQKKDSDGASTSQQHASNSSSSVHNLQSSIRDQSNEENSNGLA
ncbi:hypothetical protein VCUG_02695, partial [Vavraia culicis subsp. floridensis]